MAGFSNPGIERMKPSSAVEGFRGDILNHRSLGAFENMMYAHGVFVYIIDPKVATPCGVVSSLVVILEARETFIVMPHRFTPTITETFRNNAPRTCYDMLDFAESDDPCGGGCRVPISEGDLP